MERDRDTERERERIITLYISIKIEAYNYIDQNKVHNNFIGQIECTQTIIYRSKLKHITALF